MGATEGQYDFGHDPAKPLDPVQLQVLTGMIAIMRSQGDRKGRPYAQDASAPGHICNSRASLSLAGCAGRYSFGKSSCGFSAGCSSMTL